MAPAGNFQDWAGRSRSSVAIIHRETSERLAATFGIACDGKELPPCWHWLYHLDAVERSRINLDGHPTAGDFLPPIPAKRRMFAGSSLRFHRPVHFGASTELRQTVSRIEKKTGRQGDIWLITIVIELLEAEQLLIEEQKTIVLLQNSGAPRTGRQTVMAGHWSEPESPDAVQLFRFSALTFNAHRIHYDLEYATGVEGYPERVIHGPLQAMLLALKAEEWSDRKLRSFAFRGIAPAFLGDVLTFKGHRSDINRLQLEVHAQDGIVTTTADAELDPE